jgi:transcriptional regulator with XRE-family HTH domain
MKFGDYLRQKREEKNWTQPEASSAAGIEQSYLSKLETGKSWPSEDVFARLTTAYGIDVEDLARKVSSSELARLREVSAVRSAVLELHNGQKLASRGWLIASLVCLVICAASAGLTAMGMAEPPKQVTTFVYRSHGELQPGEPLDAFDVFDSAQLDPQLPNYPELEARRQKMLARVRSFDNATTEFRGAAYIDKFDEHVRKYTLVNQTKEMVRSPLWWFYVPALTFLAGAVGCAFISFRWK